MKSKSIQIVLFLLTISSFQAGALMIASAEIIPAVDIYENVTFSSYPAENRMAVESASPNSFGTTTNPLNGIASAVTIVGTAAAQETFNFNHSSNLVLSLLPGFITVQKDLKFSAPITGTIFFKQLAETISKYVNSTPTAVPVVALPITLNLFSFSKSLVPISLSIVLLGLVFAQRKRFNLAPELSMLQSFRC